MARNKVVEPVVYVLALEIIRGSGGRLLWLATKLLNQSSLFFALEIIREKWWTLLGLNQ